jgi:hypothetical protein
MVGEGGREIDFLGGNRTPEFLFHEKRRKKSTYLSEKETAREEARPAYL